MVDKNKIKQQLEKELIKLQKQFSTAYELKIKYLSSNERVNDNGNRLSGEIQNSFILIYETDLDKAKETLRHEFLEFIIDNHTRNYIDIINNQNRIIERLLYRNRENLINKLSEGM